MATYEEEMGKITDWYRNKEEDGDLTALEERMIHLINHQHSLIERAHAALLKAADRQLGIAEAIEILATLSPQAEIPEEQ